MTAATRQAMAATRAALRHAIIGDVAGSRSGGRHDARSGYREDDGGFPRSRTFQRLLEPRNRAIAKALLAGGALLAVRRLPAGRLTSMTTVLMTLLRALR